MHRPVPLTPLKLLRIALLLVLALLLPIRGAVAAAMLCPAAGADVSMEVAGPHHHAGADDAADGAHADAGPHHHHAAQDGAPDKCNLCSACCPLSPLAGGAPGVPPPLEVGGVGFPTLSAPAPVFLSGGLERPPRTR